MQMTNDMLSQEEIDALLNGDMNDIDDTDEQNSLTDDEIDALGEIGNISMGTAATTLFTLLGSKVIITTPIVTTTSSEELAINYPTPFVGVDVKYKLGLEGSNLMILKAEDVKAITDIMMGGDGTNTDRPLNDMDLSAISEVMNQMIGSASTSLSEIFSKKIDIEPPQAFEMEFSDDNMSIDLFQANDRFIKISFKMVVGEIIDSEIMQLIPIKFAKKLTGELLNNNDVIENNDKIDKHNETNAVNQDKNITKDEVSISLNSMDIKEENSNIINNKESKKDYVNVKKVNFQSFDKNEKIRYNESIDIIQDIPVEISVELGRTKKKISEVLEYGSGTIIELDKLVGEPLEIFANGKMIAKGEVVVIDDNFGIRITDIIRKIKH